ncbi:MAG: Re/Si-specific NAD(P)(+) transhydrogenase subunit alpha [Bradymonadaceae bacterium]
MTELGVPVEHGDGERRVALTPDVAADLSDRYGAEVLVETGAGERALIDDDAFRQAGAAIVDRERVFGADVVATVGSPTSADLDDVDQGQLLIGLFSPLEQPETVADLAERGLRVISMELIPRISRAQSMDVLSAMGSLAGYRAMVEAAEALPKFFPLLTTAAGTIRPADVLVLGAGVAGLQGIATAKRLGARVTGYDIREATREEIESLGADFLEIELETGGAETEGGYAREQDEQFQRKQPDLLAPHVADADVVLTTAQIPGKPAPKLVTAEAVEAMAPGSVVYDLAAPSGGNCELTEPGEIVHHPDEQRGAAVHGPTNVPSRMAPQASELYAQCIGSLVGTIVDENGGLALDLDDEIVDEALVCADGTIRNERVASLHSGEN